MIAFTLSINTLKMSWIEIKKTKSNPFKKGEPNQVQNGESNQVGHGESNQVKNSGQSKTSDAYDSARVV